MKHCHTTGADLKLHYSIKIIMSSESICNLLVMWLLRMFLFVLWIGKCILISVMRLTLSLLQDWSRRYLNVALLALMVSTSQQSKNDSVDEDMTPMEELEERPAASPLLPLVVKDRVQISEANLAIKDRERLLFEFDKIVAPQVSAFQLGEITVPVNDTRQLSTFLRQTCFKATSRSEEEAAAMIKAAICGAILNMRSTGAPRFSNCVDMSTWNDQKNCTVGKYNIQLAVVYIAASLHHGMLHLVLVGRKVDECLGSSEFRTRFNPPRTRRDQNEWNSWTQAMLKSLKENAILTAEELLLLS